MAVLLTGVVQHFIGVAADDKPTAPPGSTFYETDTRTTYVSDGASWTLKSEAVSGAVASGAADTGNPVKVGGKYNTTLPTLTDGQRGDLQVSPHGQLRIQAGYGATGQDGLGNGNLFRFASATSPSAATVPEAAGMHFNGTTWDRTRGNVEATGLASAARTTSTATPDQTSYNGRGAQVFLDVTATPNNAETLQVVVEAKDPVSGKYVQVAAFTALTASVLGATPTTATYVYTIYPGAVETIAAASHEVQAIPLPRTWRARAVHSAAGSWTYSVGVGSLV